MKTEHEDLADQLIAEFARVVGTSDFGSLSDDPIANQDKILAGVAFTMKTLVTIASRLDTEHRMINHEITLGEPLRLGDVMALVVLLAADIKRGDNGEDLTAQLLHLLMRLMFETTSGWMQAIDAAKGEGDEADHVTH